MGDEHEVRRQLAHRHAAWFASNRRMLDRMADLIAGRATEHLRTRSRWLAKVSPDQLGVELDAFVLTDVMRSEAQFDLLEDAWFEFLQQRPAVKGDFRIASLRDRAIILANRLCRDVSHSPFSWPVLTGGQLVRLEDVQNISEEESDDVCEVFSADPAGKSIRRSVVKVQNLRLISA